MAKASKSAKRTVNIILDTNALFVPLQFKIDIFEELKNLLNANFKLLVLPPVRKELERLAEEGSLQMRKKASYALELSQKCTLIEANEEQAISTDDAIVKAADKYGYAVLTNDKQLKKKLRDINVPVIYVRQKSRLEIDGRL